MRTENLVSLSDAKELDTSIKIHIAITDQEKRNVYRFRYQVFIEEMSKKPHETDYQNQLLHDNLDKTAFLLYATIDHKMIGTIRVNIGSIDDFPSDMIEALGLKLFQVKTVQKIAFLSKLMIALPYRNTPALYRLLAEAYKLYYPEQIDFVFSFCHFYLISFYEKTGCRRYYKNYFVPGYGLATPIVLLVNDTNHFHTIRSPLYRIAKKNNATHTESIEWFHSTFTNQSSILNSQLISKDNLWIELSSRLHALPNQAISLLQGLSMEEAQLFLHTCGVVVQCTAGDQVTMLGDISYAYFVLLSGKLTSLTFRRPLKEYAVPGQLIGANGLTEHNKHTQDIKVVAPTELLVLSGVSFQKFYRTHSDIAHKIISNIRAAQQKRLLKVY